MNWLMPANSTKYDHASAFQHWGFIDWRQNDRKYQINDIVYIYCTRPIQKVMYKTIVEKVNQSADEIVDDKNFWLIAEEHKKSSSGLYVRLKLVEQADNNKLSLQSLIDNGLSSAPQSSIKIYDSLVDYIEKYLRDNYNEDIFPDSSCTEECFEGAKTKVYVNKYERSSVARRKCIEFKGYSCIVCGFNFEDIYGEIGRDFIHIHHLKALNEIGEEYIVDYKNDLVPVCPNCHAMLHRRTNGKFMNPDELREHLTNKKRPC